MRMRGLLTFVLVTLLFAGLPAVASAQAAKSTVAPKIAAYNVFMLSRALYPNWGQVKRADLIAQQGVLAGQDVVILNEIFDNTAGDRLESNLKSQYPYQTPVVGRSRSGWDATEGAYSSFTPEDGGVAVLSRWPVERKVQFVYPDGCGADAMSNKGFAYVRLRSPGGAVHVIGTHMQSEDPGCGESPAGVRAAQRKDIAAFIQRQNIPAGEPLYVGGDMNVIGTSAEYGQMLSSLNARTPRLTGHQYSWDCPGNSICQDQYGPEYEPEHLDYVLAIAGHPSPDTLVNETRAVKSPQWSVTSWGTTYTYNDYSDHYPVYAYGG